MAKNKAYSIAGLMGMFLLVAPVLPVHGFPSKPDEAWASEVVDHLLATNFTKQCDVNTYPLRKNLSFLFENKYMGVDFESWEVEALEGERYRVVLHYIDGEAGPTAAKWRVNMAAQEIALKDENAQVLSCMTGYL
ncbi:MAG: hypothetical protein ABEJ96_02765 [Thiohalorhabdaceae bacterium]